MKNTIDTSIYFDLGARVLVGDKAKMPGVLKYLGTVHFVGGIWCGVELDKEEGLHDGLVQGVRYFTCPPSKGVLAPLSRVQPVRCSSLERNKNHGVLFDCPFESIPPTTSNINRISRLPRPAYSTRQNDDSMMCNQYQSHEADCLFGVKSEDARLRKSSSPKKVTFDMKPESLNEESNYSWEKCRSESDSLLLCDKINSNFENDQNVSEDDLTKFNKSFSEEIIHQVGSCISSRPKTISASLNAVESDLNDLLHKIDKEISNVETPDTAEINSFLPDLFVNKINKDYRFKKNNDLLVGVDDDCMNGLPAERCDKMREQRKIDDAGDDDIMLLTGSPTFRLAQTAMVQYAELLKASQAGLVAQRVRFQQSNLNKTPICVYGTNGVVYAGRKTNQDLDSPPKNKTVLFDTSNSTGSSNDDVYETFDGEDLYTLKFPHEDDLIKEALTGNNTNVNFIDYQIEEAKSKVSSVKTTDPTSEDICNFLDSLLKSGQELEQWLEISVADLKCDHQKDKVSHDDDAVTNPQNLSENYFTQKFKILSEEKKITESGNGSYIKCDVIFDEIIKSRPFSYASTIDSTDTGCPMDGDITNSFAIDDSLHLESWNESFRSDTGQQMDESTEKSIFDYLDIGAIESMTDKISGHPLNKVANLIDFEANELIDNKDIDTPKEHKIAGQSNNETTLFKAQPLVDTYIVSIERQTYNSVPRIDEINKKTDGTDNTNYNFDNLHLSSTQNTADEAASDSQEANASGLTSTPGSSFSSYGSRDLQRYHELLPRDILSDSFLAGDCLNQSIQPLQSNDETFGSVKLTTNRVNSNSSITKDNVVDVVDDDDDEEEEEEEDEKWKTTNMNESTRVHNETNDNEQGKCSTENKIFKKNENSKRSIMITKMEAKKSLNVNQIQPKVIDSKQNLKHKTTSKINQSNSSKLPLNKATAKSMSDKGPNKRENETKVDIYDKKTKPGQFSTKLPSSIKSENPRETASNVSTMSSSLVIIRSDKMFRSKINNRSINTTKSSVLQSGQLKLTRRVDDKIKAKSTKNFEPKENLTDGKINSIHKKKGGLGISPDEKSVYQSIKRTVCDDDDDTRSNSKTILKIHNSKIVKQINSCTKNKFITPAKNVMKGELVVPKCDSKSMKNVKNTTERQISTDDLFICEVVELKNQVNEAKNLADQYHREKNDFERLMTSHERQYKDRIRKFEKAMEEKLAWLKCDLEVKHAHLIEELTEKHERDIGKMKDANDKRFTELKKNFEDAKAAYEKNIKDLNYERNAAIEEINDKYSKEIKDITQKNETSMKILEDKIIEVQRELDSSLSRERNVENVAKHDRDLRQQALLEIDSLEVVVETRNLELKKLRTQNSTLEERLQEIPVMKEKMTSMQRKIEELETILASKREHEKELMDTSQKLLKKSIEGDEAVRKLSMNNEELIWRLSKSDLGSPIHHPFSPTHSSPNSPMSRSAVSFSTPLRK